MARELKLLNMIFNQLKYGYIQKMNPMSSKLNELYDFCEATWGKIYQTRFSNLKILGYFFSIWVPYFMGAQFLHRSNFYIAVCGLAQVCHWFPRRGFKSFSPRTWNPYLVGLLLRRKGGRIIGLIFVILLSNLSQGCPKIL